MYFNPLFDIIAAEYTSPRHQNPKMNKILKANNILSERKDDNIMQTTDGKEESESIKFWLGTKAHPLMDCNNFEGKTTDERQYLLYPKDFVITIFQKIIVQRTVN